MSKQAQHKQASEQVTQGVLFSKRIRELQGEGFILPCQLWPSLGNPEDRAKKHTGQVA